MEIFSEGEFWVGVGTAIFLGILVWKRVPALIGKLLDTRAAVIAKELDDARKLREEAEGLLALYKKKQADAEKEASLIIADAQAEAERFAKDARIAFDAQMGRRAKQAEEKIAQAEAQALAEIRGLAADAAVAAAEKLITQRLTDAQGAALVKAAIQEIPGKFN